jgi:hypothetical protein
MNFRDDIITQHMQTRGQMDEMMALISQKKFLDIFHDKIRRHELGHEISGSFDKPVAWIIIYVISRILLGKSGTWCTRDQNAKITLLYTKL